MSFLKDIEQFNTKRLRKTETTVMTVDGRRLLETKNEHGGYKQENIGQDLGFVGDYKPDLQVAQIITGLYLGSQDVAANKEILDQHKITHILNLSPGIEPCFTQDFNHVTIPILDLPETDITSYFPQCFKFINGTLENGGCVFVHCNAGVSRSASVIIGYLMRYHKKDFEEAYNWLKSQRSAIQPNAGFMAQLKQYKTD